MKKLSIKFLALLMITSVAFLSCKKEDRFSPSEEYASRPFPVNPVINGADWRITTFRVNGKNEAEIFNRYRFEFADKGVLKAIIKNEEIFGTWGMGLKDNPGTFKISFLSKPLNRLNNGEWKIMNRTSTDIVLQYINRKPAQTMYLILQRPIHLEDTGVEEQNPN